MSYRGFMGVEFSVACCSCEGCTTERIAAAERCSNHVEMMLNNRCGMTDFHAAYTTCVAAACSCLQAVP